MSAAERVLVLTANPASESLTMHARDALLAGLKGIDHEVIDLAQIDFDPRFNLEDRRAYQVGVGQPDDVRDFQLRLEGVTDLVLVFPVFWWSLPSLLKGWLDRVLTKGWAYDWSPEEGVTAKMGWLTVHLMPTSAMRSSVWERHGYYAAFKTNIEHGIVEFCGMRPGVTAFVHDSENPETAASDAEQSARKILSAIR